MNIRMQSNFYKNALQGIAQGIQYGADAVAPTIGIGSNVIIEKEVYPFQIVTNDANSIIMALEVEDALEKRGLFFLKEGATATTNQSGDGRTTMVLLLNSILQGGLKAIQNKEITPLQLKKELDECLPIIEASIKDQTKEISVEEIPSVAEIAGENHEIAQTLGGIYKEIGKEGIIHLEGSGTYSTNYKIINGVRFAGTGFLSPFLVHDDVAVKENRKETRAIYQNPSILVTKRKISHLNDINPLLKSLEAQGKKDLVIFTDDMDSSVASILIEAHKKKVLNILIIKAPVFWKQYVFEDFAKVTGSTIIEDASGITFKNLQLSHLGTCETIIVDKEECTVIGIQDIKEHIESIQADESMPSADKKLRLSWLVTKTAILKLGAKSETELSYLMLKCTDAIHSSRLALRSGIVAGGGVCLLNASRTLPNTIGGRILAIALWIPLAQIIKNTGSDYSATDTTFGNTTGFDAKTLKPINMFEAGIVDASEVVLSSIRNALGIASTILTSSSVITLPPKKEVLSANPMQF